MDCRSVTGTGQNRKRNWKSSLFVFLMIILTALVNPSAGEEPSGRSSYSADYGVFSEISELHKEESTRANDVDVLQSVQPVLNSISRSERDFSDTGDNRLMEKELEVPPAITKSPVIFDALRENPIINNTSVLDWILPPPASSQGALNYILLVRSGDRFVWKLGSITPKLGIFTDSGLDKWLYVDVDGDPATGDASGNDIRARMTFAKDLLARDWQVSLIPPRLEFNNAGIRIEVQSTVTGESPDISGSAYFIKGISYSEKNYIWSVGVAMDDIRDSVTLKVQARKWRAEPDAGLIGRLLQGGTINMGELNLLEILGPFRVSYEFDSAPESMDVFISVMRLMERNLRDMAYVKIGLSADELHEFLVPEGSLSIGVQSMGSPIDSLQWDAGTEGIAEDSIHLSLRYTEFSSDLIDAHLDIPSLPGHLRMDMAYTEDSRGRNRTVLDMNIPGGLPELVFLEAIYPDWESGVNLTGWNATRVMLYGVPETVHLETTAAALFSVDEPQSQGLNFMDSLMTSLAGRFYRLGTILREIPRTVAEMPSRKGSTIVDCKGERVDRVDFVSTSGKYLEGTGNMVAFFDDDETGPSIHASLSGISYYRGSFEEEGNDIILRMDSADRLEIFAVTDEETAVMTIDGMPDQLHLETSDDLITYEGTSNGEPQKIESVRYRFRDGDLRFDVDINGIPSTLSMIRSSDQIEVSSSSGPIGSLQLFTSNRSSGKAIDLPERNFISLFSDSKGSSVGMRINRFRSFKYNNGTNGFIELNTVQQANFYTLIEDRNARLDVTAAFVPLPSFTHIDMPSIVDMPEITIPDLMGARSISDYGDLLFSLEAIGKAPIGLASSLSKGLVGAIGQYSTDLSLSWDLAEGSTDLDLIATISKDGKRPVNESKWTHGIWMEQSGMGENSSIDGKIYLNGMPASGSVNLSFSSRLIEATIDFRDYSPDFDWFLVRTTGVQDRDISLYLTGIQNGIDLLLDMRIFTDLSIGGRMAVDLYISVSDQEGRPVDLGSMIATLIKASPILSIRQMFLPMVPSILDMTADIGNGVSADYSASSSLDYLYFKITKRIEQRWSQVYSIFHDLPLTFYVNMTPNNEFSIQKPFITQGLPSIDLRTEGRGMDIFIEYDGSGFGQRGKFQIYADDLGSTRAYYDGDDYVMDSQGIGFFSLQVDRLPMMEQFTLSSLTLLGMDIEHVRISSEMVYGIYPRIILADTQGGSFQIKMSGDINLEGNTMSPDIFFITLRTTSIAGTELPTGLFINKDTSAVNLGKSEGAIVMPAPMLTMWNHALSSLFGGAG